MMRSNKDNPRVASLKKLERSSIWVEHPVVTVGVVLLLAIADGLNLFAAFDKTLTESLYVLLGIVVAFSICLEGIPVLIARLMRDVSYNGWSWFKKVVLVLLLCGFMTVFGFAAYVKIATRELMLSPGSTGLVNTVDSSTVSSISSSAKDNAYLATTIAMAALPLATSILCFYLGWLSSDPVKAEARKYRLFIVEMQERRASIVAARAELGTPEARRDQLITREQELYKDALNANAAEENLAKAMAAEAFFDGKNADQLTLISSREITEASYDPKTSALEKTQDAQEEPAPGSTQDKVVTIPVQRNN